MTNSLSIQGNGDEETRTSLAPFCAHRNCCTANIPANQERRTQLPRTPTTQKSPSPLVVASVDFSSPFLEQTRRSSFVFAYPLVFKFFTKPL
jgi:hypothetical protein